MNNRRRNQILIGVVIVEVIAVVILVTRVAQVCCAAPSNLTVPTTVALNPTTELPIHAVETSTLEDALVLSITPTAMAATASLSATTEASPTASLTATVLPDSPTPTASLTDLPATPTSTLSPTVEPSSPTANGLPATNPPPIAAQLVVVPTTVPLPTIPIPTAVPTITQPPTRLPPTRTPTATATPTLAATVTRVSTATLAPTAIQESGQCSYGWAINPLPDVTAAAQGAINAAGLNSVTVRSEAYGENCYDSISGRLLYFGAMTTDFYLTAPVSDFADVDTMGQIVITAYNTLTTLNIALPARPGYLDITFTVGSDKKHFRAVFEDVKAAMDAGKTGAALIAVGGIT